MVLIIKINGKNAQRLDSTSSISFQAIEGESLIYALNEFNICASTGSACSSGSLAPSHVLQAMKIPFTFAHGTIRFSFGRFNTQEDFNQLTPTLKIIVENLRKISPFWDSEKQIAHGSKHRHAQHARQKVESFHSWLVCRYHATYHQCQKSCVDECQFFDAGHVTSYTGLISQARLMR